MVDARRSRPGAQGARTRARGLGQGPAFWRPINFNGSLPKIAVARRKWLEIHQAGLRQLRDAIPAPTGAQRHALAVYDEMLAAIRGVIPPAPPKPG
jgi:hypothetical protein